MYGSGRLVCKQVDSLSRVFGSRPTARQCNVAREPEITVKIPKRIKRGPTDILKALSLTVSRDFTAFEYKYPDDPYFYPYVGQSKRINAFALESGRNAAKWVIESNPKFFAHKLSEPLVEEFVPKVADQTEVTGTEEELLNVIRERNVSKAIEVYKALKDKNESIQDSTKQSLLELVCFYNSEDKPSLSVEEKWFENLDFLKRRGDKDVENTWKSDGFAEQLFADMNTRCPLAYAAMIQGMVKYNEIKKGMSLYEEAQVKKMKLPVKVYNTLLSSSSAIVELNKDVLSFVNYIVEDMVQNNVRPDLDTFNSLLKAMSRTRQTGMVKKFWREFVNLGIKPSLGSYGYLFKTFSRIRGEEGEKPPLLGRTKEILKNLMTERFEIVHPCDLNFFSNSMEAFFYGFDDVDLVIELQKMMSMPEFERFVSSAAVEKTFYTQFLTMLFKKKDFEFAMMNYKRYIFTVLSPDASFFTKVVLKAVGDNQASEALVEVWKDIKLLNLQTHNYGKGLLLETLLALSKDFSDEVSLKVFYEAALTYVNTVQAKLADGEVDRFPPAILQILIKSDDEAKALEVLKLINENDLLFTIIMDNDVALAFSYGMSKQNPEFIRESLKFASREEYHLIGELVEKALPFLSETEKEWALGLAAERQKGKQKRDAQDFFSEEEEN